MQRNSLYTHTNQESEHSITNERGGREHTAPTTYYQLPAYQRITLGTATAPYGFSTHQEQGGKEGVCMSSSSRRSTGVSHRPKYERTMQVHGERVRAERGGERILRPFSRLPLRAIYVTGHNTVLCILPQASLHKAAIYGYLLANSFLSALVLRCFAFLMDEYSCFTQNQRAGPRASPCLACCPLVSVGRARGCVSERGRCYTMLTVLVHRTLTSSSRAHRSENSSASISSHVKSASSSRLESSSDWYDCGDASLVRSLASRRLPAAIRRDSHGRRRRRGRGPPWG